MQAVRSSAYAALQEPAASRNWAARMRMGTARLCWNATWVVSAWAGRQVGGEDAEEYKRAVRGRLRELVDRAGEAQAGAAPDWLVLYACPPAAGPASKPAGKARRCSKHMHGFS